jgi:hypothetical protein
METGGVALSRAADGLFSRRQCEFRVHIVRYVSITGRSVRVNTTPEDCYRVRLIGDLERFPAQRFAPRF